jgi:argininosuccinate lyase
MIGLVATVTAMSRTPTGQPDNRLLIYGELPAALRQASEVAALMQEVLEQLTLNAERGRELVENGWTLATDLAEMLVLECGLSFRAAHQLVGFLAGKLRDARELSADLIVALCEQCLGLRIELSQEQFETALDPELALQCRNEAGGAASARVAEMSCDCALQFAEHYRHAQEARAFLDAKARDLLTLAEALAAS